MAAQAGAKKLSGPGIGALLGGRYKVLAKLGEGGMGTVFHAENIVTGKHVAVKWMHPQVASNHDATERLLREARATSRLSHPNVVDVYDVVQDDQTLFLVMELLHGETLRSYLKRELNPRVHDFIALLLPAVAGVAAAHEQGVIHRDLKPDNIFLARIAGSRTPAIKVLDFGIAKLTALQGMTLTETGITLGTPLYMSLEQLRGDRNVDARTDVYAFGVMLYEGLTGQLPYTATTLPELAIRVATSDPAPVKSLRPDLPTALAHLVDWAIVRDRAERLPDMQTLLHELETFSRESSLRQETTNAAAPIPQLARGERAPLAAPPPPRAATAQAAPAVVARVETPDTLTAREVGAQRRARAGRRSRSTWVALTALTTLGLAGGVYVWLKPPPSAAVTVNRPPAEPHVAAVAAAVAPSSAPTELPPARNGDAPAPTPSAVLAPPSAASKPGMTMDRAAPEPAAVLNKPKAPQASRLKRSTAARTAPNPAPVPTSPTSKAPDASENVGAKAAPKKTAAEILAF